MAIPTMTVVGIESLDDFRALVCLPLHMRVRLHACVCVCACCVACGTRMPACLCVRVHMRACSHRACGGACSKHSEFALWAVDVQKVDVELLPKLEEKELFKTYMEDYNTGTHTCPPSAYLNFALLQAFCGSCVGGHCSIGRLPLA